MRCGASVRDVDPRDGGTALHRMAERNRLYGAAALLAGGADVNARDGRRQTALHVAARERHRDMAMLLLAFGASSNADDADGKRASDYDPDFPWTSEGPTRSGAAAVQQVRNNETSNHTITTDPNPPTEPPPPRPKKTAASRQAR